MGECNELSGESTFLIMIKLIVIMFKGRRYEELR